jgi:hypothetical protein
MIWTSHRGSGYQIGKTVTDFYEIIPAKLMAHVGLASLQAASDEPFGAAIGIMDATFVNQNGIDKVVNFGGKDTWETALYPNMDVAPGYDRIRYITIGAWVVRGDMKGWSYIQVWG